jgi:DNA invertase Pin-like site-specific DNA recombinase
MPERLPRKALRCAIYTRKSSEEGLEQDFNSLQAQREACEAYIASQKHEGWKVLQTAYDGGAYSGGTMERPALQQLLADITAERIDVVVVHKVDRLTRALADFAKIVEIFDRHGVSFVSVTQQFNTTSSMGRLTLNVLLSFAQFEREVTGERIRDKIAASKKKGLWMGGFVPLGYRANQRTLIIHEPEARIVRTIFQLYHQIGSVLKVEVELRRRGINRPSSTTMTSKRVYGARPFMRGEIYKLLENPIYIGEIHHKGYRYQGQHPPIVYRRLLNAVRTKLAANAHDRRVGRNIAEPSLLAGLLQDDHGNRLTPTHTVKKGKRYRYYASLHRRAGKPGPETDETRSSPPNWRIPAAEIETTVIAQLAKRLADPHWLMKNAAERQTITQRKALIRNGKTIAARLQSLAGADLRAQLLSLVTRITLSDGVLRIDVDQSLFTRAAMGRTLPAQKHPAQGKQIDDRVRSSTKQRQVKAGDTVQIHVPIALSRRGMETKLIISAPDERHNSRKPDPVLVKLIANAHRWWGDLVTGRYPTTRALAQAYGTDERYVARVLQLAFLAPSIVNAIVVEQQPIELTAQRLMTLRNLPHNWNTQQNLALLNFDPLPTSATSKGRVRTLRRVENSL